MLVPSETFTKVMFSCLWWAPCSPLPSGTGGLDCLLLLSALAWRDQAQLGDPHVGLGTGYSVGLSRRAQGGQGGRGPQPHRRPLGKVCEGCGGEEQGAGRALEGVGDGSEAEGCGGLPKKAGIES